MLFRQIRMRVGRAAMGAALLCFAASAQEPKQPDAGVFRQDMPPTPKGKSTVIGGRIGQLDPVRDQFRLEVYGSKPLKLLYDARTELYRDGVRAPLSSLRSGERASVETTLDGTAVFALKLHVLSAAPKGDCSGQVQAWDPVRGWLEVVCRDAGARVDFRVRQATEISSKDGTPSGSGLGNGDLVEVAFEPNPNGQGTATRILLVAKVGASFVLHGELVSLDISAGRMIVMDARENTSYALSFTPGALPSTTEIQQGTKVKVDARFNGTGYTAVSVDSE